MTPSRARPALPTDRGTSLIEALVATAVVLVTLAGVAHLLVWSRRAVWSAGAGSVTATLAAQKLEQLRALRWEVDGEGQPASDLETNLATDPPSAGGWGLRPSPPGTLAGNVPGFVDFLDAEGAWRGTGTPPAGAVYVRRWAIVPYAADPLHTLALHAVVSPLADEASGASPPSFMTTMITRGLR